MINAGEDLLICDLAQTYGILDYKALRPTLVAALASGLPDDCRIKRHIVGQRQPLDIVLMAIIADKLANLCWLNSTDGAKGRNRPDSILDLLLRDPGEELATFDSAEQYRQRRREILGNGRRN